jgi:hypothetical protein
VVLFPVWVWLRQVRTYAVRRPDRFLGNDFRQKSRHIRQIFTKNKLYENLSGLIWRNCVTHKQVRRFMNMKRKSRKFMTRRQFIRSSATAATGLLLAACTGNSRTEEVAPTESLVEIQPANTPRPITVADSPTNTPTLQATATGTPTTAPTATTAPQATATAPMPTDTPVVSETQQLISNMTLAATLFFEALDAPQRDKASYAFNHDERYRWHWTTPRGFPRNGLPLREMNDDQRSRAFDL